MSVLLSMCQKFEDDEEFDKAMSKLGTEANSLKMTTRKLKEKYGASI